MAREWISVPAPFDNPDLVGSWTGQFSLLIVPGTDLQVITLDVFHPTPLRAKPVWIRCFHGTTPDELIERFGQWLDTVLGNDTIK